jgi:Ser/Thr protein kinase RdoA (MazF antagonist)
MMKLKYLLDNRDLALELLRNWDFDPQRLDLLDQYRISSNAIYPFYQNGKVCFLRFAPTEEKSAQSVQAELDFISYLSRNGYHVPQTIPCHSGKDLLLANTMWGEYVAVVFTRALGQKAEGMAYGDSFFVQYGATLAQLHQLSRKYIPPGYMRANWEQNLEWTEACLQDCKAPRKAHIELQLVFDALRKLPVTESNYGLIHYDFELDNVFYASDSGIFTTIDFDDSVYHWYAMDVERSLHNLTEELDSEQVQAAKDGFLQGYTSVCDLPNEMPSAFPIFTRYAGLFQYARCLRATSQQSTNEPDWMKSLREYLAKLMHNNERVFGSKL